MEWRISINCLFYKYPSLPLKFIRSCLVFPGTKSRALYFLGLWSQLRERRGWAPQQMWYLSIQSRTGVGLDMRERREAEPWAPKDLRDSTGIIVFLGHRPRSGPVAKRESGEGSPGDQRVLPFLLPVWGQAWEERTEVEPWAPRNGSPMFSWA